MLDIFRVRTFFWTINTQNIKYTYEDSCHGTVQIIRAQVQKQSPKRSNSQT
jgi:hypothetical protein